MDVSFAGVRPSAPRTGPTPLADPLTDAQLPGDELSETLRDPILRLESGAPAIAAASAFSQATATGGGDVPYRRDMEQSFGADFSGVRAHVGKSAEAGAMGAVAATQRDSIVFAESSPSRETVAHELAHVRQFDNGAVPAGPAVGAQPG